MVLKLPFSVTGGSGTITSFSELEKLRCVLIRMIRLIDAPAIMKKYHKKLFIHHFRKLHVILCHARLNGKSS